METPFLPSFQRSQWAMGKMVRNRLCSAPLVPGFSTLEPDWHLQLANSLSWGAVLGTVGHLVAMLTYTHKTLLSTPPTAPVWQPQMALDIVKCPLKDRWWATTALSLKQWLQLQDSLARVIKLNRGLRARLPGKGTSVWSVLCHLILTDRKPEHNSPAVCVWYHQPTFFTISGNQGSGKVSLSPTLARLVRGSTGLTPHNRPSFRSNVRSTSWESLSPEGTQIPLCL